MKSLIFVAAVVATVSAGTIEVVPVSTTPPPHAEVWSGLQKVQDKMFAGLQSLQSHPGYPADLTVKKSQILQASDVPSEFDKQMRLIVDARFDELSQQWEDKMKSIVPTGHPNGFPFGFEHHRSTTIANKRRLNFLDETLNFPSQLFSHGSTRAPHSTGKPFFVHDDVKGLAEDVDVFNLLGPVHGSTRAPHPTGNPLFVKGLAEDLDVFNLWGSVHGSTHAPRSTVHPDVLQSMQDSLDDLSPLKFATKIPKLTILGETWAPKLLDHTGFPKIGLSQLNPWVQHGSSTHAPFASLADKVESALNLRAFHGKEPAE